MAEDRSFTRTITEESDYEFRIRFEDTTIPDLLTDESPPIGRGAGPDPSSLLGAAVGNCLSASLLFALRKYKNTPRRIVTRVRVDVARNAQARLRVGRIAADIRLPETAADYTQIERLLAQFEEFCIVTESVRAGVPVDVTVSDATGAVLHTSARTA
jgi:organic hydroperoxide reductase OsmC/OhrA